MSPPGSIRRRALSSAVVVARVALCVAALCVASDARADEPEELPPLEWSEPEDRDEAGGEAPRREEEPPDETTAREPDAEIGQRGRFSLSAQVGWSVELPDFERPGYTRPDEIVSVWLGALYVPSYEPMASFLALGLDLDFRTRVWGADTVDVMPTARIGYGWMFEEGSWAYRTLPDWAKLSFPKLRAYLILGIRPHVSNLRPQALRAGFGISLPFLAPVVTAGYLFMVGELGALPGELPLIPNTLEFTVQQSLGGHTDFLLRMSLGF